jgi:hypothetical protein
VIEEQGMGWVDPINPNVPPPASPSHPCGEGEDVD